MGFQHIKDKERLREIAAKGGRTQLPESRSFSRDRALAAEAGRKGGQISKRPKRKAKPHAPAAE